MSDIIRVGGYHIDNVYEPPPEHWNNTNLSPVLPQPAVLVGDFNSHHLDWGYQEADLNGESLQEGHWTATTPSKAAHSTLQGGNVTTHQTCIGSPGASCTPAHFSHSRRFTQSRPGSTPNLQTVTSNGAGCSLAIVPGICGRVGPFLKFA